MTDGGLTPDLPLGPFEGVSITAYTPSRSAKLHASRHCSRLRAGKISEVGLPLNAATIERMCPQCATWGRWVPERTALGIFLKVITGLGFVYELNSHVEPDPDGDVTDAEIDSAAVLLRKGDYPAENLSEDGADDSEDDLWEAFKEARELRDSQIIPEWFAAMESLMMAAEAVTQYPWLKPWAAERMKLKSQYAETMRLKAARLLNRDALVVASRVRQMPHPELPADDSAFVALGDPMDVLGALEKLWREWQHQVSDGWLTPEECTYPVRQLEDRMGKRRRGRDELRARAEELLVNWSATAHEAVAVSARQPERLIAASISAPQKERHGSRKPFHARLTRWELGTLIAFAVAADWATRTLLLKVPSLVAERLLADGGDLNCIECAGDPQDGAAYESLLLSSTQERLVMAKRGAILPGLLDDTPVSRRRPVTLAEVRTLRELLDDSTQLFIVASSTDGVEILSLAAVEERCENGCSCILIAEAGDLPSPLFSLDQDSAPEDDSDEVPPSTWEARYVTPDHLEFGQYLGMPDGEHWLRRLNRGREDRRRLEHELRVLALARGVHDLRTLDHVNDDEKRAIPRDVWLALLVPRAHLDLQPFMPQVSQNRRESGLGLPMAILADLQIYTTNADPRIAGKGHSPFCQHVKERGVRHDDFLLTLERVAHDTDFDWCANCGGYAMRRLSKDQLSYYRSAHRLLELDGAIVKELDGHGAAQADLDIAKAVLSEISQGFGGYHSPLQVGDRWRIEDVISALQTKIDRLARYRRDGWPDAGSVIPLKPKR